MAILADGYKGPMAAKQSYYSSLTGLRAFAAMLVFAHHVFGHWFGGSNWIQVLLREGYIGVSIFFTLSGFLITRTYFERFAAGAIGFWEYWLRRIVRIYPVYLLLLGVGYLCAEQTVKNPQQLLILLTLTQAYFSEHVFSGLHPSWSLTVEESFYLAAPLMFWFVARVAPKNRAKSPGKALIGVATFAGAMYVIGTYFIRIYGGTGLLSLWKNFETYSIFTRFWEFGAGAGLALALPRIEGALRRHANLLAVAAFVFWVASLWGLAAAKAKAQVSFGILAPNGIPLQGLATVGATLWIAASCGGSRVAGFLMGNRLMEILGRASYVGYLIQSRQIFVTYLAPGVSDFASLFTIWWVASLGFYFGFEKPVHQRLTAVLDRKFGRSRSVKRAAKLPAKSKKKLKAA